MGLSRTRALSRIRRSKLGENDSFNYIPLRWGIIWLDPVDQWYFTLVYMAPLLYLVCQMFLRFNSVCIISHGTFALRWNSGKYKLGTVHKVDVVIFDIRRTPLNDIRPSLMNLLFLTPSIWCASILVDSRIITIIDLAPWGPMHWIDPQIVFVDIYMNSPGINSF